METNSSANKKMVCSVCGKNLPLTEFLLVDRHNNKITCGTCKQCRIKQQAKENKKPINHDDDDEGGGGKGNRVGVKDDPTVVKKGAAETFRERAEESQERAEKTLEGEDAAHEGETKDTKEAKDKKSDNKAADKKTEKSSKADNKDTKSAGKERAEQAAKGADSKTAQGLFGQQRGGEHDSLARNESMGSTADGMFRKPATPAATNNNDKPSAASITSLSSGRK